jgi:transposase-like protein
MVAKLVGPHAVSANTLAKETGIAQGTLSRWLREASTLKPTMPSKNDDKPAPKQIQAWTPEEKLAVVLEAASLSEGELGLFLRAKGLSTAVLDECVSVRPKSDGILAPRLSRGPARGRRGRAQGSEGAAPAVTAALAVSAAAAVAARCA